MLCKDNGFRGRNYLLFMKSLVYGRVLRNRGAKLGEISAKESLFFMDSLRRDGVLKDTTMKVGDYVLGKNLSSDHLALIRGSHPERIWMISYVDNFVYDRQVTLGYCIGISGKNFGDFMREQAEWIKTQRHFLGERLKRDPTKSELFADLENYKTLARARLVYGLAYPENICLVKGIKPKQFLKVRDFFGVAEEIRSAANANGKYYGGL